MIHIQEAAAKQVSSMLKEEGMDRYFLRLGVYDGGCSGLSYRIALDDALEEGDHVIEMETFQVVIDRASMTYMDGAQLDYKEAGMTGGFTIDNPNAKLTCGCGASFRTAQYKGKAKKCD